MVDASLKRYIEENVLPLYDSNIGGHGIDHIKTVIERSFSLVREFGLDVNLNMVYVIAAFHDIGYKVDPDRHEEVSSDMFRADLEMKKYFSDEEIGIMADAIVDHRASLEYEARSVYGKIVSSADREVSIDNMLKRSILFQADKHKAEVPSISKVIDYSYKKLSSKYGNGGYAKMYYPDRKYQEFLEGMRKILSDRNEFMKRELEVIKKYNLGLPNNLLFGVGDYCKHFKGKSLVDKSIYRIEEVGVEGSNIDTSKVLYTGDQDLETANNLVVYSNVFQDGKLFTREYESLVEELSPEKRMASNQLFRVMPLTSEEVEAIGKSAFINTKKKLVKKI